MHSLEPRLSIPDFSKTESLCSRLGDAYVHVCIPLIPRLINMVMVREGVAENHLCDRKSRSASSVSIVSIISSLYAYRRLRFRGRGSHSGCRIRRTRMLFPDPQYTKLQVC